MDSNSVLISFLFGQFRCPEPPSLNPLQTWKGISLLISDILSLAQTISRSQRFSLYDFLCFSLSIWLQLSMYVWHSLYHTQTDNLSLSLFPRRISLPMWYTDTHALYDSHSLCLWYRDALGLSLPPTYLSPCGILILMLSTTLSLSLSPWDTLILMLYTTLSVSARQIIMLSKIPFPHIYLSVPPCDVIQMLSSTPSIPPIFMFSTSLSLSLSLSLSDPLPPLHPRIVIVLYETRSFYRIISLSLSLSLSMYIYIYIYMHECEC